MGPNFSSSDALTHVTWFYFIYIYTCGVSLYCIGNQIGCYIHIFSILYINIQYMGNNSIRTCILFLSSLWTHNKYYDQTLTLCLSILRWQNDSSFLVTLINGEFERKERFPLRLCICVISYNAYEIYIKFGTVCPLLLYNLFIIS